MQMFSKRLCAFDGRRVAFKSSVEGSAFSLGDGLSMRGLLCFLLLAAFLLLVYSL